MHLGARWWVGLGLMAAVAVSGALVMRTVITPAAAQAPDPGRTVYTTYCATCHGGSGRGDGPSAAGFATKPADLTAGRLLNQLPDEFLASVIRNGGPAEGLSPGMPAFGRFLSEEQTAQVIRYVRALAQPAFRPELARSVVSVSPAPKQPIFFSHLIHAGSFQIACQYCHADARRSEYAGVPSVERCLGCHKIIGVGDNPEIAKIHEYARRAQPIPWVRVFKVPEFTYFPHKSHVRAGLACQTCHGAIERMRVVGADTGRGLANDLKNLVGLRPPARPLTMGWCVECHRQQNAIRGLRAPLDCVTCHH